MKLLKDPRLRAYLGLAVLAAGLVGLALSGDLLVHTLRFASFYVLSGAGFALLATAAASLPLRAAIVAAVILRLVFLPGMPSLTTDYYRYVWDGRVQLAGINPYKYPPYKHQLDGVQFADRALINHDELKTAYPPLTEAVFLGVAAVTHAAGLENAVTPRAEVILFKLVFGAFDLATAAAVWFLAARRFRLRATVLYLLCPAVILQTWESAHAEAAAVFFCVLTAALLVRRRDGRAGIALGLAAALKVTPLALLVPALLGGRASPARFLAGFIPAFVIGYIPYLFTGGAFGSLFQIGTSWTGGSIVFTVLAVLTTPQIARWLALALFVGGALWVAGSFRERENTAEAFAWTFTLLILCLPVVHAWYWLTPLALGLAAGLWLPLVVGMFSPLPESLPLTEWLTRARQLAATGGGVKTGLVLSLQRALAILKR
jgi:Glycosyltransferase family 87